ncbi:MAG TPA: WcaI family glycosyltransferase [Devosia sp.]|jgi:colanic acid biosynthesis glycosyl transferase WcaI|nr:WcaI family glycosyltransferase [Devosia sp.]
MKVLILGINYAPERVGIAVYTTSMARALVRAGHEVSVVTAQPYYPGWAIMDDYRQRYSRSREDGVDILRCPLYVPRNPTGARRLVHHASFAATTFIPTIAAALRQKPDIVFTPAPSLIAAPVARFAAWLSGAKSWVHVQDFEVEAAFATGLLQPKGRIARLAAWFERSVLRSFHQTSSISPQMCAKLIEKGVPPAKVVEFRNSGDLHSVKPLSGPSPYRAEWNITTPHVALYSGNIANKQGIEIVIDAARRLAHRKDLSFVVCGEGPNRANLQALAAGLDNIQFHDLQPKERIGDLVGLASIHLLPQLAGAADLVLPSKLINMLASGRPVVATAAHGTGLALEVEGCGLVTPPGDGAAFADGIAQLLDDAALYSSAATAARARAEERWAQDTILARLVRQFEALAKGSQPDAGIKLTSS